MTTATTPGLPRAHESSGSGAADFAVRVQRAPRPGSGAFDLASVCHVLVSVLYVESEVTEERGNE